MNLLTDPALHKRIAAAVRLRCPREWQDGRSRRVRALNPAREPAYILAWLFLRLTTAWLITLANRLPGIPPAAAAGINALAVLWLLPRVQRLVEAAAARCADRDVLVFLPVSWSTIAKADAVLRRRALLLALFQCYAMALCICLMTGLLAVEPGVFWRGLISAAGLTILMMALGIIASILRGWPGSAGWKQGIVGISRIAILTQLIYFGFAVAKVDPPVSYEWIAKLAFWFPHGRLMLWNSTGGAFPWPDFLLCLVPAILVWPAIRRVLNPVPDDALPHPDAVPEPPKFTAEQLAARSKRALRRSEFLDDAEDDDRESAPESPSASDRDGDEDAEDEEENLASELASRRPEAGSEEKASPEFLTAASGLVRKKLDDPDFANPAGMLVPPLPPWSESRGIIRSRLLLVIGIVLVTGIMTAAGSGAANLIAAFSWLLAFCLPFMAATRPPGGTVPALARVTAGPGTFVPLYTWLPVDPGILRQNSDAWAMRMVLSGTAFAALAATAAWLIANGVTLLCTQAGWTTPVGFAMLSSLRGPYSALQYFFLMTGVLLLSRVYQQARLVSASLRGFRAGWSARLMQLLISLCSITAMAGTIVGSILAITASGGTKPWTHAIWIVAEVCIIVAEIARYAGGVALDGLLRHAKGEYRS